MPYGYSQRIVEANKSADRRLIGVALGRICIANGIPVSEIATQFGVSRQTVYNWFEGKHVPKEGLLADIKAYVKSSSK